MIHSPLEVKERLTVREVPSRGPNDHGFSQCHVRGPRSSIVIDAGGAYT